MKCKVRAFGITSDILGGKEIVLDIDGKNVAGLRKTLEANYPEIKTLKSLFIAVNNSYAHDEVAISENDEIALIPPVSGG